MIGWEMRRAVRRHDGRRVAAVLIMDCGSVECQWFGFAASKYERKMFDTLGEAEEWVERLLAAAIMRGEAPEVAA